MIESRRRFGLSHEPLAGVGAKSELGRKDLECDTALQPPVAGSIDYSGPASPELFLNVVIRLDRVLHAGC
jgi:hypothetical protein